MTLRHSVFAIVLAILLLLPMFSAAAQTPVSEEPDSELEGLQQAVLRVYMPPGAFQGTGQIDIENATPVTDASGLQHIRMITITVYEYESSEHAADAQERLTEKLAALADGMFQSGTHDIVTEDLSDLGQQASLVRVDHDDDGTRYWLEDAIVQQDEFVLVVVAEGSVFSMPGSEDIDTSLPTLDIATVILEDGEKSSEEVVFSEDGTSSGGIWGFMPEAEQSVLQGMEADVDFVTYPESAG